MQIFVNFVFIIFEYYKFFIYSCYSFFQIIEISLLFIKINSIVFERATIFFVILRLLITKKTKDTFIDNKSIDSNFEICDKLSTIASFFSKI